MDSTADSTAVSEVPAKSNGWGLNNRRPADEMFGLCSLVADVQSTIDLSDARLTVEVGHAEYSLSVPDVATSVNEGHWRFIVHVLSHLLPNGSQRFRFTIHWPDGRTIELPDATFKVRNDGALASSVRQSLASHGCPAVFGQVVDASHFPYDDESVKQWFEKMNDDVPLSTNPVPDMEIARRHLARWGFVVLPETIPHALVTQFNREIDEAIASGVLRYVSGTNQRIHGAHLLPAGRNIWLFEPVMRFLRDWFNDEPCACQTLLYINGSEQRAHQDTIHLTPFPAGMMCGVWVALEDIQADSGELFIFPGSHRLQRLRAGELGLAKVSSDYSSYVVFDDAMASMLKESNLESVVYRPKAGQILVWHENLAHGGSRRFDPAVTRRSIVSHYYPRGGVAYYDSRGEAAHLESLT